MLTYSDKIKEKRAQNKIPSYCVSLKYNDVLFVKSCKHKMRVTSCLASYTKYER